MFTIPEGPTSTIPYQVTLYAIDDVTFITLKALDGQTLAAPVKIQVRSEGGGCSSAEPPKVDAVELRE